MPKKNKTLVELYQEARGKLEFVQQWKGAMMDKVREDALAKTSRIHEAYMLDAVEAQFRDVVKSFVVVNSVGGVTEDVIKEYIFLPDGIIVVYSTPEEPRDIDVKYTWEEIQNGINKQLSS